MGIKGVGEIFEVRVGDLVVYIFCFKLSLKMIRYSIESCF